MIHKILFFVATSVLFTQASAFDLIPSETDSLAWHQSTVLGAFATPSRSNFIELKVPSPRQGRGLPLRIWKSQERPLGLVVLIPGTGANSDSVQAAGLASTLISQNYDVLIVANPFSRDFQRTFSRDFLVGFPQNDSPQVFQMVEESYKAYVKYRGKPKAVFLAGISLGGTYALRFASMPTNFKIEKYIAINPPVTFANAISRIDDSIRASLNDGEVSFLEIVFDNLIPLVDLAWVRKIPLEIANLNLFKVHVSPVEKVNMAIIGASFQNGLKSIAKGLFEADIYGIHEKRVLERTLSSMTFSRYMGLAGIAIDDDSIRRHSFESLINEGNLDVQISRAPDRRKLYVIHSADDFLLLPGDLKVIESYLGSHLQVLRSGGHCGALWTKAFGRSIIKILRE